MATSELEQLVFQMDVNLKKLDAKMSRAIATTDKTTTAMQAKMDRLGSSLGDSIGRHIGDAAGQVPLLGDALSGLGGPAAAATGALALLAVGLNQAREAMDWGDVLQEQADRIGISAEALQEFQFAAAESDVSLEALQSGLEALNGSLGAFKTGVGDAKVKKVFEYLDVTPEQAARMGDASDLLPVIADKLAGLSSQAEQVQLAKKLGVEALLPLLKNGAQGIEEIRLRARDLGLVLDDQTVKSLADMNREVEIASDRLDKGLKRAFLGLAPVIVGTTEATADFVGWLNKALTSYGKFLEMKRSDGALRLEARRNGITTREGQDQYVIDNRESDYGSALDRTRRRQSKTEATFPNAQKITIKEDPAGGSSRSRKAPEKVMAGGLTESAYNTLRSGWKEQPESWTDGPDMLVKHFQDAKDIIGDVTVTLDGLPVAYNAVAEELKSIGRETANAFLDASNSGRDLLEVLGEILKRRALEKAAGAAGDLIDKGIDFVFSKAKIPGFATGTASAPGGLAYVHKDELIDLPKGSRVWTASQTSDILSRAGASRSGGVAQVLRFDLRGAVMTQDLLNQMSRMAQAASVQGAYGGSALSQAAAAQSDWNRLR